MPAADNGYAWSRQYRNASHDIAESVVSSEWAAGSTKAVPIARLWAADDVVALDLPLA